MLRIRTGFNANPAQHFKSMRIRMRICNSASRSRFLLTKNLKNLQLKKTIFFYLSLGLHKGRPSYRRSIQPSKENIQHFKTWNFFTFFYLSGSGSGFRIRIRWPDWILFQSGSGSGSKTILYIKLPPPKMGTIIRRNLFFSILTFAHWLALPAKMTVKVLFLNYSFSLMKLILSSKSMKKLVFNIFPARIWDLYHSSTRWLAYCSDPDCIWIYSFQWIRIRNPDPTKVEKS